MSIINTARQQVNINGVMFDIPVDPRAARDDLDRFRFSFVQVVLFMSQQNTMMNFRLSRLEEASILDPATQEEFDQWMRAQQEALEAQAAAAKTVLS